ncbi:MAG: hypothetical protein L6Q95_19085, partial [Planctomycetes bacterium]|nr:hypothetical protein [Planctomycetota bacterium]
THREPEVTRSVARADPPRRAAEAPLQGMQGGAGGEGEAAAAPGPPVVPGPAAAAPGDLASAALRAEFRKKHVLDLEKSKAAAERLGVPPDSLEVARRAYLCVVNHADPKTQKEALDALRELGEGRMAAVTALLYGAEEGPIGTDWLEVLLGVARFDGQEHRLVEFLKDAESPAWAKRAVIEQADAVDAEVVRGYLLERLAGEEDRYVWSSIAMSLGRMREGRAVAACAEGLRRGGDWQPFEIYALWALGEIGDFAAEAALLAYVDGPEPAHPYDGLRALAKIDAGKARARAETLLGHEARARLLEELDKR